MAFSFPVYLTCAGKSENGQISVGPATTRLNTSGWRAVLKINGQDKRIFGNSLKTKLASTVALMDRMAGLFSVDEMDRVRKLLLTHEASGQKPCGSQPTKEGTALSQHKSNKNVRRVHQMYGLFRDGKPMSDLFLQSSGRWQQVAADMGAQYHMWSADEVDTLMRDHYDKYMAMYRGVRYPVMRADIGRVAILHRYGGLYVDCDVIPNRTAYPQTALGVSLVPGKTAGSSRLDMELLIARAGNPILLAWLDHMAAEIESKTYADKKSFWYGAKMRYIYNTTGPYSMTRFLRLPANKDAYANIVFLNLSSPIQDAGQGLSAAQKRLYDALSYQSISYFTKKQTVSAVVSDHSVELPSPPKKKRLRVKSNVSAFETDDWRKITRTTSPGDTEGQAAGSQPTMAVNEMAKLREENAILKKFLKTDIFGEDSDEDARPGNGGALTAGTDIEIADGAQTNAPERPALPHEGVAKILEILAQAQSLEEQLHAERKEHGGTQRYLQWLTTHACSLNALIWEGKETRPGGRFWEALPEDIRNYIAHTRVEEVD